MRRIHLIGNGSHHTGTIAHSARSLLLLSFLAFVTSRQFALAAEQEQPKNVLILYSFSDRGLFDPLDHLKSAIRSRLNLPVNYYVDYMEAQGFEDPGYEKSLSQTLSREFSGLKLDLVIVAAYPALQFAVTYRDQMFPGVPILFCYVHEGRLEGKQLWPDVTGVTISIGVRDTLELSFRLHPGSQNLALVTGTSEFERYWRAAVLNEFRPYAGRLRLIEIVGLRNDEILKQVAALPAATVVLFQLMPRDSTQPEVGFYDTMAAISQRFPTYSIFKNYCIDHGGIGGSYADYAEQSLKTGEIAARLLSGEKPENIPVEHDSAARAIVDQRQIRRWNIPESALPPGTIFLYREPTVWEQYKWRIVAVIALCIFQSLLIVGLLIQRSRRRQAEEAKNNLAAIVESSDDAILSKNLEGIITSWNAGAEKMYGYSASEIVGQHISALAPADLKDEVQGILERIRRGESVDHLEAVRVTKDGRRIDASVTISPIKDEHGVIIGASTIASDITERKRHERALQQLTGRLIMLQDEERQRVAAELHDGLGQSLAIIKNRALICLGDQANQDLAIEQLEEISAIATSSIREVREIAHNLRPYELDRLGLVAAIESMLERVSDSTSINLAKDLEQIDGLLLPEAETSVYRIVQEALNNVMKHSHATAARIEMKKNGKQLTISVQDNGKGMPSPAPADNGDAPRGFGLTGIAQRVRLLGGSFAIESQPAHGTTLSIRLELPSETRE